MSLYHNESLWGSHRVTVVAHKVIVKVTLRRCESTVIRRAHKLWWRHIDCEVNANSQRGHYESLWGHTKLLWGHTSDLNAQSNCESHRVSMRAHIVIVRSHTVILSTQRIIVRGHKLIVSLKNSRRTQIHCESTQKLLWRSHIIIVGAHKSLWRLQSVMVSHIIIIRTHEVTVMAQNIIAKGSQHHCKGHKESLSGDHEVINEGM